MASYKVKPAQSSAVSSKKQSNSYKPRSRQTLQEQNGTDMVAQDQIWREYLRGENNLVKEWEKNWGFLTEIDSQFQAVVNKEKEFPEKLNIFSESLPNTSSGSYGSKLGTSFGRQMQNLEFKFYANLRKKRSGEFLCC